MQKTKLGVKIGTLSAVVYFTALFGGMIPLFLLVGYILLKEENDWLKRVCYKAVAIVIVSTLLINVISLIPSALSIIASFVALFEGYFSYAVVSSIVNILMSIVNFVVDLLLLVLGIKAYKMQDVKVDKIDKMIEEA